MAMRTQDELQYFIYLLEEVAKTKTSSTEISPDQWVRECSNWLLAKTDQLPPLITDNVDYSTTEGLGCRRSNIAIIEKAKAMCSEAGFDPCGQRLYSRDEMTPVKWANWMGYLPQARAALMLENGVAQLDQQRSGVFV